MLVDLLNWACFLCMSYVFGLAAATAVTHRNLENKLSGMDIYVALGIVVLTVYGEVFSIFSGVGAVAFLSCLFACLLCAWHHRTKMQTDLQEVREAWKQQPAFMRVALIASGLLFLALSAVEPKSYDDYLYHAQAIEWIETHGSILGLGNLHCRLAYNSAFMCLQALFSWAWLPCVGQSLHALNALFAFLLSAYCILRLRLSHDCLKADNLLRFAALIYILLNIGALCSVDTDPLPMFLCLYIFLKWSEWQDEGNRRAAEYAFLVLLGVFACTLKLSAAPLLLLAAYPLAMFWRTKQWKAIMGCLVIAMGISVPFLVRNIILSGYLFYPMESLDIFDVIWKIPHSVVRGDRECILIWGKHLHQLRQSGYSHSALLDFSLLEWVPIWFSYLFWPYKVLFFGSVATLLGAACYGITRTVRRTRVRWDDFLLVVGICTFAFWMQSAPLPRYGGVYMTLFPAVFWGKWHSAFEKGIGQKTLRWGCILFCCLISMAMIRLAYRSGGVKNLGIWNIVCPQDYMIRECNETTIVLGQETFHVYYPAKGEDRTDYAHFPAAAYYQDIENLRCIGSRWTDGFYSSRSQ